MVIVRTLGVSLVGLLLTATAGTAQLPKLNPPKLSPPKLSPPPLKLPDLSQLDPNKKGSVANQGLNQGLNGLKQLTPSKGKGVNNDTELSIPPTTGAQPGKPLGTTSTVKPDEYLGRNAEGKGMWRSGKTGQVYYTDESLLLSKPKPASTGEGQPLGTSAPGIPLSPPGGAAKPPAATPPQPSSTGLEYVGKTADGKSVYKNPKTGEYVIR